MQKERVKFYWNIIYYILWKKETYIMVDGTKGLQKFLQWLIPKRFWTKAMKEPQISEKFAQSYCYTIAQKELRTIVDTNSNIIAVVVLALLRGFHLPLVWLISITVVVYLLVSWKVSGNLSENLIYPTAKRKKFFKQCDAQPRAWKVGYAIITSLLFITGFTMVGLTGVMIFLCVDPV